MAVPHRRLVIDVTQNPADRVEIDARVDYEAGRAVPQIVDPNARQLGLNPRGILDHMFA